MRAFLVEPLEEGIEAGLGIEGAKATFAALP